MFTINKKNIELSNNNTIQILKSRVASALGTIPSLIDDLPAIKNGGNYTIKDPVFYIYDNNKIGIRKENNEPINWNQVQNYDLEPLLLKNLYIVAKVQYTIENFNIRDTNQAINFAFLELDLEFPNEGDQMNVWVNKQITINKFKDLIENNLKMLKKQMKSLNVWNDINPPFESTALLINKINHGTEIKNLPFKNELMVFDSIKLNNDAIACFYLDMVKYNPSYTELVDDYLSQDRVFFKKVKASEIIRVMVKDEDKKYKMINIYVKNDLISFSIITMLNEINVVEKLKQNIKNIVTDLFGESGYKERKEIEYYYGSFTSKVNVFTLVLKDLITSDSNIYALCYTNESDVINTRKTYINLYIKSNESLGLIADIGVTLFEKQEGTLIKLKKIPGGENLSSKISTCQTMINKILQYAILKSDNILNFYKQYITIKTENRSSSTVEQPTKTQNSLKTMVPNLFISNSKKLCNKPPIISPNNNYDEVEGCNEKYLKFPVYGETDPKIFECPYFDHNYPGLRINKLENKNIFPYIPCCYKRPQKQSKNCKVYFDQETQTQRINSGEIAKSLKILTPKRQGVLPPRIDKILHYTTNVKFYRYGIPLSPNCCLYLLNMVTRNQNSFKEIRTRLSSKIELCKGNIKALELQDLKNKVLDEAYYINPRNFKNVLEDYYKLSFILFSKDKDDFSIYENNFLKDCRLKSKVIFIIEHEEENHVELIVDTETLNYVNKQNKEPVFTFDVDDELVENVISIYKKRFDYATFSLNKKSIVKEVVDQHPFLTSNNEIIPLNKYIDMYGKVRLVEFMYKNINFVVEFDPIFCFTLKNIRPLKYFKNINNQLSYNEKEFIKQKIIRNFEHCKLYNPFNSNEIDLYNNFKSMKKLSNYILWLACYVYSNMFLESRLSVDEWIQRHTRIVENFTYSGVTIKPIYDVTGVMVNSKFIFDSFELQEKIRFNLNLISTINLKLYKNNYYHNFYNDVTNFNVIYPAQLALTKEEYFKNTRKAYKLHIFSNEQLPYIQPYVLYLITDLFNITYLKNKLCLFHLSISELIETANTMLLGANAFSKVVLNKTKMTFILVENEKIKHYSIGDTSNQLLLVLLINVNNDWYYGLILPSIT